MAVAGKNSQFEKENYSDDDVDEEEARVAELPLDDVINLNYLNQLIF
jgi:hypothetical protein